MIATRLGRYAPGVEKCPVATLAGGARGRAEARPSSCGAHGSGAYRHSLFRNGLIRSPELSQFAIEGLAIEAQDAAALVLLPPTASSTCRM